MAKSTPGPWEIKKCICGKCDIYWVEPPGVFSQGSGFKKEDARLIAAAPDLFQLIEEFASLTPDKWNRKEIEIHLDMLKTDIEKAKRAIAKAEGEK